MAERRPCVDPVCGHEQIRRDVEVRGRIAERPAALVAQDDEAFDLRGPAEQPCRRSGLAGAEALPDARRGDALDDRDDPDVEPELLQERRVAGGVAAEAEVLPHRDHARADSPEQRVRERPGIQACECRRELDDQRLLDRSLGE